MKNSTLALLICLLSINVIEAKEQIEQVVLRNGATASKTRVDEVWKALASLYPDDYGTLLLTANKCRRENTSPCTISDQEKHLGKILASLKITTNGDLDQETQAIISAANTGTLFKGIRPIMINVRYPVTAWKESIPFYNIVSFYRGWDTHYIGSNKSAGQEPTEEEAFKRLRDHLDEIRKQKEKQKPE